MTGKVARGGLAHVAYAEGINQAGERGVLAAPDGSHDVLRSSLGHSLEPGERVRVEPVEVRRRFPRLPVDQLLAQFLAQAVDVRRAPRGEMQDCLLALGRAVQSRRA